MENGHDLYFSGNTVIPPNPGQRRRSKTLDPPAKVVYFSGRIVDDQTDKTCATKKCIWCGYKIDQYFITCPLCQNCQYCGMVDSNDPNRCFLCGNYLPKELRVDPTIIISS